MEKSPHNLPYFMMIPSCGIITCPPNTRKSCRAYTTGTEYDFYPNFICWKPKSKWNLTKFDFLRTQENDLNWCIPTVRNSPIMLQFYPHFSTFLTHVTLCALSLPQHLPMCTQHVPPNHGNYSCLCCTHVITAKDGNPEGLRLKSYLMHK